MKKTLMFTAVALFVTFNAQAQSTILSFGTMVGVHGGFVKHNAIRGVRGDEAPWVLTSASGTLTSDGHLTMTIRGLVFANDPSVPPDLVGKNDETAFRGLVSCLSDDGHGRVSTVNVITEGSPATVTGDSDIDTTIALPQQCVAPIVFVLAGSEDLWFAVTGGEK